MNNSTLTASSSTSFTAGITLPEKNDTPTGDCTLAYTTDSSGNLKLTFNPSLPQTEGRHYLYFYDANGYFRTSFGTGSNSVWLSTMFAGNDANTYTRARFADVVNETEMTIADLDKSLTIAYSGTPINITGITIEDDPDDDEWWIATITTDVTLDRNASYILIDKDSNGGRGAGSTSIDDNGNIRDYIWKDDSDAGETLTYYLVKATGSVDANGNATLTYTPKGNGYSWTVPEAE